MLIGDPDWKITLPHLSYCVLQLQGSMVRSQLTRKSYSFKHYPLLLLY